jgi:Ca2+/Na+ antiporter
MQTAYDWVTLTIFAGLVVLFMQRSVSEDRDDSILAYLAGAVVCAFANYMGNNGHDVLAIALILANLVFIFVVLKPIDLKRPS